MKYQAEDAGIVTKAKDYSKKIIFSPGDFSRTGHLLQMVTIPPLTSQRSHYHHHQTEVFYVIRGRCSIFINSVEYNPQPGDAFICEPEDKHYLWNRSRKEFKLLVFKINFDPNKDDTVWEG